MQKTAAIQEGKTTLGIEFGSTRIKAVLMGEDGTTLASGSYDWENQLVQGVWTYDMNEVFKGLRASYKNLAEEVKGKYGIVLTTIGAIGVSAMMHGYLAFDKADNLLVPFRTWRNTMTGEAVKELTELFQFNIPQRWSIAHLYQAILNREEHVDRIHFLTTLAGFVHWKLTGEKVLGIGDASGMFPVDSETKQYHKRMLSQFNQLVEKEQYTWQLEKILPQIRMAGEEAGRLTEEGAKLLDETGNLKAGIIMCPPEGDAGTGMVATNSVKQRTGNVSAGTSVFAMVVMEHGLSKIYPQIDMVTTPEGKPVAMVHCNNCTSDLNAWISLFGECLDSFGVRPDKNELYANLYRKALDGEKDCGGLLAYNYYSGEHITGFREGRPLFVRLPESKLNLSNFMRVHLYTSLGALKTGLNILLKEEQVAIDKMVGHGGFFKTREMAQKTMAAAINAPVAVMETAGEGGAWGIALLAAYTIWKKEGESLDQYLNRNVFANQTVYIMQPEKEDVESFELFMERYTAGLPIEQAAIDFFKEDKRC